jgi:glutamyl-Q tRNA(Asp) synthetase
MTSTFRTFRFAPSPNGHLHLGHAYSALLNFDLARQTGGRCLLRIEDIDATRCRSEYETAIYEDLAWLGLAWEEPVRRQSEHLDAYRTAIERLRRQGLVYASFESRAEIARLVREHDAAGPWPRDPDGAPLYPGGAQALPADERERRMRAGEPFAVRLDMKAALAAARAAASGRAAPAWRETQGDGRIETIAADPSVWGDVVLGRKETPTSYHLSVVIDDAAQGVTDIVRGQDLFAATGVHRLLQILLDLPEPTYRHHRLVLDDDGRKLAKSSRSTALRALRQQGATPHDIRRMVGCG